MLAGLAALQMLAPSAALAGQDPCPEGGVKIDSGGGPMSFACPEGEVITGICVKAGQAGFCVGDGDPGAGEGCYEFSELGGSVGSVGGGGTGRDCRAISHSHFYCDEGEPPSDPVCGDGVIDEGELCDPPGPINDLLFCNEACQIVEDPPEDPVCGNGVTEAGEQCDPPGRIDGDHICTPTCQIVFDEEGEDPICGDGAIDPGEQCDPPGRINDDAVCTDVCLKVFDPLVN
jgi:hypothetical protein